jgi:hypothetical protein
MKNEKMAGVNSVPVVGAHIYYANPIGYWRIIIQKIKLSLTRQ